jgi:hypothetical protein
MITCGKRATGRGWDWPPRTLTSALPASARSAPTGTHGQTGTSLTRAGVGPLVLPGRHPPVERER